MTIYALALLIGVVTGMRTMMGPAAVCWFAYLGWLEFGESWLGFLQNLWTRVTFTLAALGEFVGDQLPSTPARTVPFSFGARILSGGFSGAAIAAGSGGVLWGGLVAGVVGAILGTLAGLNFRTRLAKAFGRDMPAAFLEDGLAILGAVLIGLALR